MSRNETMLKSKQFVTTNNYIVFDITFLHLTSSRELAIVSIFYLQTFTHRLRETSYTVKYLMYDIIPRCLDSWISRGVFRFAFQ